MIAEEVQIIIGKVTRWSTAKYVHDGSRRRLHKDRRLRVRNKAKKALWRKWALPHKKATSDEAWVPYYDPKSIRQRMPAHLSSKKSQPKHQEAKSCWRYFVSLNVWFLATISKNSKLDEFQRRGEEVWFFSTFQEEYLEKKYYYYLLGEVHKYWWGCWKVREVLFCN